MTTKHPETWGPCRKRGGMVDLLVFDGTALCFELRFRCDRGDARVRKSSAPTWHLIPIGRQRFPQHDRREAFDLRLKPNWRPPIPQLTSRSRELSFQQTPR